MMPDLKLNLKFEVEVLCKNISFDIDQIEPADILRPITVEKEEPSQTTLAGPGSQTYDDTFLAPCRCLAVS